MAHSFSAYSLMAGDTPPHIIDQILPHGGMVNLFSPPKVGKSILGMQMALAVSNPAIGDFLGYPVHSHGPVLYLQVDTPRNLWISRLLDQAKSGIHIPPDLWFLDRDDCPDYAFNILNPEHWAWLKEEVEQAPYLLVVVDVIREIHEAEENDSTAMKRVITALRKATGDAALLIISHTRKPSREAAPGLMHNARGSNYLAGKVDTVMELRPKKLVMQGRSLPYTSLPLRQLPENRFFLPDEDLHSMVDSLKASFPDKSDREIASLLHEKLEGRRSLEACRGIVRRMHEKEDV